MGRTAIVWGSAAAHNLAAYSQSELGFATHFNMYPERRAARRGRPPSAWRSHRRRRCHVRARPWGFTPWGRISAVGRPRVGRRAWHWEIGVLHSRRCSGRRSCKIRPALRRCGCSSSLHGVAHEHGKVAGGLGAALGRRHRGDPESGAFRGVRTRAAELQKVSRPLDDRVMWKAAPIDSARRA
jgi:hypothetical protein